MIDQRFRTAGWLVFLKMGVDLLMMAFFVFILTTGHRSVGPVVLRGIVLIAMSLLNVYILFSLRSLLWDRYDFHQADVIIPVLAWAGVGLEILNEGTELMQTVNPAGEATAVAVRILLFVVPMGILTLIFAAGLLKLPFSEKSLLRPYAYLTLGLGIVLISMVLVFVSPIFTFFLFPVFVLTGVAADVLLGLTFLRSQETEQVDFV
jgi:hypothetical protein